MTLSSSTSKKKLQIQQDREPWVHRRFQQDRLRAQERYWRPVSSPIEEIGSNDASYRIIVIPNALVWRKYLDLLSQLIEVTNKIDNGNKNNDDSIHTNWVLLESVVEFMDYRTVSPSITVIRTSTDADRNYDDANGQTKIPEKAAFQERNRFQRWLQNGNVQPFCDLSVRQRYQEEDEWSLFRYTEMDIIDRSRHALIRAGTLFHSIDDKAKGVILLVDDDEIAHYPNDQSDVDTQILTLGQFLASLTKRHVISSEIREQFLQSKQRCKDDYKIRNAPPTPTQNQNEPTIGPTPYLTVTRVQAGLSNNTLERGQLQVTKANYVEAYVTCHSSGRRYFINQERGHFNRALHSDVVVIQPLPQAEWGRPLGRKRLVHRKDQDENDTLSFNSSNDNPSVPSARVVAISKSSRRTYVATLGDQHEGFSNAAVLAVPMNQCIPKIRLISKDWQRLAHKRLLVAIDSWDITSHYPNGHVVRLIGDVGDLETEISCLLLEHDILLDPFSANAMACLPPLGKYWTIPEAQLKQRRDLRHSHRIFSVDPPGCQDIDDTMHARVLPNGDIEVGVHIADVTYFVEHNSPLDKEAQLRATTFYLVDRRFDMLPALLSSDLCSLHGNTDRLAVSVIWTLSPDLENIKDCWYGRTIIHNCQAMTYEQAHNILHNKSPDDPTKAPPPSLTTGAPVDPNNIELLRNDLSILTRLARKLRKDREKLGGAVDLSSGDLGTELKFVLDENSIPTHVSNKKELEIHHTIAEMMILANQYVARKIFESFPASSLLRIHQTVEEDRFDDLRSALQAGGMSFDGSSNMALAQSLNKAKQQANGGVVNSLISLATRAMSEAKYISTGDQTGADLTHYGLGIEKYTHFTSPIRRYADVVVHKQLLAALTNEHISTGKSCFVDQTTNRTFLAAVPNSNVMSVLGENRSELESSDLLDSLIEDVSGITIRSTTTANTDTRSLETSPDETPRKKPLVPYTATTVANICQNLNDQNRKAKQSSFECQRLFLSLYFREHVEVTQAVVTGLRVNGLLVYVPKFNMKGPVFLSDVDGNLQIDPTLVALPPIAGSPPTLAFVAAKNSRKLSSGTCTLEEPDEDGSDRLVIRVPESQQQCVFRPLDIVMVQLSCDTSDSAARVPPPRLHLLSMGNKVSSTMDTSHPKKVSSKMIQENMKPHKPKKRHNHSSPINATLYTIGSSIKIRSVLEGVPLRSEQPLSKVRKDNTRVETMTGRIKFCGFSNPDTLINTQAAAAAAAAEAAAKRRAVAVANQTIANYQTTQTIEKSVTDRMQRLNAAKRNARRSKAN